VCSADADERWGLGMSQRRGRATIRMYLRSPQILWAYYAALSNPSIGQLIDSSDCVVVFDDPANVPARAADTHCRTQYLMIFWDGLIDDGLCQAAQRILGTKDIRFFVVGDYSAVANGSLGIKSLYADGPLNFSTNTIHLDWKTAVLLQAARIKGLLMPLKNIFQKRSNTWEEMALLLGKKQIVFCGSVGISPPLIKMFCERHAVDRNLFANHEYYDERATPSLERHRAYVRNEGLLLAKLYDAGQIDVPFFVSCMQLVGRSYLIERIRDAGLRLYANNYSNGSFVDIYSTPFYSQHVFLDFGSVVGTGNYPRLVDLKYFGKTTVEMRLSKDFAVLHGAARAGLLDAIFEAEWIAKSPRLFELMSARG
jgi:hypothetical protein